MGEIEPSYKHFVDPPASADSVSFRDQNVVNVIMTIM
jgi:hypothetical protein